MAREPKAEPGTVVYTDGACIGNPGRGGWAWAVSAERFGSGFDPATTTQRMELTATIEAMKALQGSAKPLLIVSDSTYVVNCFKQRWWDGWPARGWRNSQRQPVANRELWETWIDLVTGYWKQQIDFQWVKGHSGEKMNELVDSLANESARKQVSLG
ncbi:MAG TPA: ribonuclease H [Acidimicrobiales bacterium]|nr:ribonuclease H [Acidimicrobiales bacterium]